MGLGQHWAQFAVYLAVALLGHHWSMDILRVWHIGHVQVVPTGHTNVGVDQQIEEFPSQPLNDNQRKRLPNSDVSSI